MATTFRANLTAAAKASLVTFIAANPTKVRRAERAQPPSIMGDLPIAFIAGRDERIHFDAQTMDRVITLSILVVSPIGDNIETTVGVDEVVDLLVDHFNLASIHFVPNSSWTDLIISDEDYPVDSADGTTAHFFATRLTFVVSLMEGRA